jgi:hypothetical protein
MYAPGDMSLVSAFISSLGEAVAGQALQLAGTLAAAGALEGGPMVGSRGGGGPGGAGGGGLVGC